MVADVTVVVQSPVHQPLAEIYILATATNRAEMVIDAAGTVIAANARAARLLARENSQVVGAPFGTFLSLLASTELEVVDRASGECRSIVATAEPIPGIRGYTRIVLEQKPQALPLPHVVHQVLRDIHVGLPENHSVRLNVGRLPAAPVAHSLAPYLNEWASVLMAFAAEYEACLSVVGRLLPFQVELLFCLTIEATADGRSPSPVQFLPPPALLEKAESLGLRLAVEGKFPVTVVRLEIPVVLA